MFLKYIMAKLWEYGMGECEIEGGIMNIVVPIYDSSDSINLYSAQHTQIETKMGRVSRNIHGNKTEQKCMETQEKINLGSDSKLYHIWYTKSSLFSS